MNRTKTMFIRRKRNKSHGEFIFERQKQCIEKLEWTHLPLRQFWIGVFKTNNSYKTYRKQAKTNTAQLFSLLDRKKSEQKSGPNKSKSHGETSKKVKWRTHALNEMCAHISAHMKCAEICFNHLLTYSFRTVQGNKRRSNRQTDNRKSTIAHTHISPLHRANWYSFSINFPA